MASEVKLRVHFTDFFQVPGRGLESHGAFNVSLINDLPLFIDPFLLFNSDKPEYQLLHDGMIEYLRFLRRKAQAVAGQPALIEAWYTFKEVKQTWLGFSEVGNRGRGLGPEFAEDLNRSLYTVFSSFGSEKVTKGSHIEKLCLIRDKVGRDTISDFTTNLIKEYLLDYTQKFAVAHVPAGLRKRVKVEKVRFNYNTESWESRTYDLPWTGQDFVILTPKDILTKDDTWINKGDLVNDFSDIVTALPNPQLRAQLNNYFLKILPEDANAKERREAARKTIFQFPEYIEYFIRYKEETGDQAVSVSAERVSDTQTLYVRQLQQFVANLQTNTGFYEVFGDTAAETRARVDYLKDVIENKSGHKIFYLNGEPIATEKQLHILFRLTWFATPSDVSQEVNDGRGPADFKISRGAWDKTIVEFKLAKNTHLKKNLAKQTELYQRASDARTGLKVIVYFTAEELERVEAILKELGLYGAKNIVLIDARLDNKPSGSKA